MTAPPLDYSRPLIMGILNLTPDSFSDGGRYPSPEAAVEQGVRMAREGADLIDIGGESTRPGAARIDAAEQERRVLTTIEALRKHLPPTVPISIDTTLAEVAAAALDAGAGLINDVSAGRDDPEILSLAAERGVPLALMHMQGRPATMQEHPRYDDVVAEVAAFLGQRAEAALAAGVRRESILLDPGIGFGKLPEHNLALLQALPRLIALGYPIVLGVSRKRILARVCGVPEPTALTPATCATTALGVLAGVAVFRVHDVAENRQAADIAAAIRDARPTADEPRPGTSPQL